MSPYDAGAASSGSRVGGAAAEAPGPDAESRRAGAGDLDRLLAAVRIEVSRRFGGNRRAAAATGAVWVKFAVWSAIAALCHVALLRFGAASAPAGQCAAVGLGLALLCLWMTVGHDAAHGVLTGRGRLDRAICYTLAALLGVDGRLYRIGHLRSHHAHPGVAGHDTELDVLRFIRWNRALAWRSCHRFQHWYAPILYLGGFLYVIWIHDFARLAKSGGATGLRLLPGALAAKCVHLAAFILLPVAAGTPWPVALSGYLVTFAIVSLVFILLNLATHVAEGTAAVAMELPFGGLGAAARQYLATRDVAPLSRAMNFVAGGLHAHVAHHLFPHISHGRYAEITRLLAATAPAFGIAYAPASLPRMVASHFRALRRLGRPSYRIHASAMSPTVTKFLRPVLAQAAADEAALARRGGPNRIDAELVALCRLTIRLCLRRGGFISADEFFARFVADYYDLIRRAVVAGATGASTPRWRRYFAATARPGASATRRGFARGLILGIAAHVLDDLPRAVAAAAARTEHERGRTVDIARIRAEQLGPSARRLVGLAAAIYARRLVRGRCAFAGAWRTRPGRRLVAACLVPFVLALLHRWRRLAWTAAAERCALVRQEGVPVHARGGLRPVGPVDVSQPIGTAARSVGTAAWRGTA